MDWPPTTIPNAQSKSPPGVKTAEKLVSMAPLRLLM